MGAAARAFWTHGLCIQARTRAHLLLCFLHAPCLTFVGVRVKPGSDSCALFSCNPLRVARLACSKHAITTSVDITALDDTIPLESLPPLNQTEVKGPALWACSC